MDYKKMTAPCGRDCFNCPLHFAKDDEKLKMFFVKKYDMDPEKVACSGCREIEGRCYFLKHLGFSSQCKIYKCVSAKKVEFCHECSDFPCDLLQPLADGADKFPHNLKVYNLCLIKRMGVDAWAESKAKASFDRYFKGKLDL